MGESGCEGRRWCCREEMGKSTDGGGGERKYAYAMVQEEGVEER